ncbi:hypothetical protein BOX15_Mlig013341g3 [Macrostomum lignano]|uniref:Uncharacterized protein n=1 Tax=Macrostomum lignano TaxID=282301 RepID=A0A267DFU0_9PLAT|nr:hypothetical protein BOX15_Mlig013341g2 [Macrostomum lignano]PAA55742.1 hypothetical protein BOX15_Mlig013341g1 [Macrostomum lignano]PAA80391.1 hypothetical protein BOX15_Mlig013341g3 [Macrostomum lignano]
MSCYVGSGQGTVSFCINTDERAELPLIVDPLQAANLHGKFDLLGRSMDVKQALDQVGQSRLTLKIFSFIDANSILIGFLLPLTVPLIHYGMKLISLLHQKFLLLTDLHRILLGPFWREVFRMPVEASLHPSYCMYVYCCDLLCISSPEPDEFFHPDNYEVFTRLSELINPLGFKIVNRDLLDKYAAEAKARDSLLTLSEESDAEMEEAGLGEMSDVEMQQWMLEDEEEGLDLEGEGMWQFGDGAADLDLAGV